MRIKYLTALCLLPWLLADAFAAPALVPLPREMTLRDGNFDWRAGTSIQAPSAAAEAVALLRIYLGPLVGAAQADGPVVFEQSPALSGEAYELEITPAKVVLRASTVGGWENSIQTLRQLMPLDQLPKPTGAPMILPCLSIKDSPRFPWRGLMLDCSRHFFDKAFLEKFLDVMALHKLNVFHWHLTDDTGWRLEIKKYPLLTAVGSWNNLYGQRSGGFYTQEDAKEIVRYAAQRNIMVVPEIEMPGHSQGALVAYPFLSCGATYEPAVDYHGRSDAAMNAGNDKTYQFIDDVLGEVAQVFPTTFLHVGGDEVAKGPWLANPECQALMKAEGLKDGKALQSYFTRRVQGMATSRGKRLIGWDEILQGGLAPGAIVMVWHEKAFPAAVAAGDDFIVCPRYPLYFDQTYWTNSVRKVYEFASLPPRVLGAQGCLWAERVSFPAGVEDRIYPRACALAEIDWSSQPKDFSGFEARLNAHLKRLDALGVHRHDTNFREVAAWRSSGSLKTPAVTQWKATEWLVGGTTNQVRFRFTGGANALEIGGVELLANHTVIASDPHHGVAGLVNENNVFVLSVPTFAPGTQLTLRATMNGQGGPDSNGDIEVKQELAAR